MARLVYIFIDEQWNDGKYYLLLINNRSCVKNMRTCRVMLREGEMSDRRGREGEGKG